MGSPQSMPAARERKRAFFWPFAVLLAWPSYGMAQSSGAPAPAASAPTATAPFQPQLPADAAAAMKPTAAAAQQVLVEAADLRGRPGREVVAEGSVLLRRGDTELRAERLVYEVPEDLVSASGGVSVRTPTASFSGPRLRLQLERFEGWFEAPVFEFQRDAIRAGGSAARIEFVGPQRSVATQASYTSCPRDGSGDPAWLLSVQRLRIDDERSEGVAEGATLRFLGVPLLTLPSLSFSLNEKRRSGWLPPNVNIDNRSGLEVAVPWYWNLAENRDATLTPHLRTRRGAGLETEFRYLERRDAGEVTLDWLPHDRVAGRKRYGLSWLHRHRASEDPVTWRAPWLEGWRYQLHWLKVSDDDWWKDFPRSVASFTPRLLTQEMRVSRDLPWPSRWLGEGQAEVLVAVQRWQVLQSAQDGIVAPYQRSPQLGLHLRGERVAGAAGAWRYALQTEVVRFTLPGNSAATSIDRPDGWRAHALAQVAWRWGGQAWWLEPALAVNAAAYRTDTAMADGRRRASRSISSYSVDAGARFERASSFLGRSVRQTLEPRLLYVDTPFRAQATLPNFDAAEKDFNFNSVYSANAFSGVDRVSDGQQLTAGVTTRLYDAQSGAELLRLAAVQRYRFVPQRVVLPTDTDANPSPLSREVSDLLLLGSSSLSARWKLDVSLQYNPDIGRLTRAVTSARYTAGGYRTLSTAYRLARSAAGQLVSEQLELAGQWPLFKRAATSASGCGGALYGVARVKYSLLDSRITDSLLGAEYDAGCWIGRVVAERVSTGRSDATTRLMLQVELLGLSRLGSNPLTLLKDNVPGYRLLRDEAASPALPAPGPAGR